MYDNTIQLELDTPDGVAKLEKIYFTELGHIMAKVYYPKTKQWVRYNIGDIQSAIKSNTKLTGTKFTNFKESIVKKVLDKV